MHQAREGGGAVLAALFRGMLREMFVQKVAIFVVRCTVSSPFFEVAKKVH